MVPDRNSCGCNINDQEVKKGKCKCGLWRKNCKEACIIKLHGKEAFNSCIVFFFLKILQDVLVPVYGQFENEIPTVFVLFS